MTVRDLLVNAQNSYADRPAIAEVTENGVVTRSFGELTRDVDRMARHLCALGLQGKHIALWGVNSYAWSVAYFAILSGVGAVVPLPVGIAPESAKRLIAMADVEAVFADDDSVDVGIPVRKLAVYEGEDDAVVPAPQEEDLAKMIFTSGTTGIPKCVQLSQANLVSIATCDFVPYAGKISISVLPLSHAFESVCHLLVYLACGSLLYMCPSIMKFPPLLAQSGCDTLYLVPALAAALLTKFRRFTDKAVNLKTIVCGGADIPEALVNSFAQMGIKLLSGYGLSECSPLVSLEVESVPGSCGRICSHNQVRISEEGEIQIKGTNVTRGYYKNEAATRAAFTEDGWFKTGDLGRVENNHLFLTGRIKNLIILSNGENVSPEELENLIINSCPGTADALVKAEGDKLTAVIYAGGAADEETFARIKADIDKMNAGLPPFKRLLGVSLTSDPLPVNATGKKIR